jgi:peptidylprolyl isomerase/FKBP-type peptidyl-prolyl cis-trans isomerase FkpA
MKKLSRNEWIAVGVSLIFVAYMFFGQEVLGFINSMSNNSLATESTMNNSEPQVGIKDLAVGGGLEIQPGMQVAVNYVLRLADGTIIQDSKQVGDGQAFKFIAGAGQLIPGWEQGILGMKVGGKRILTIPPELGYGAQAVGPIPANSTLIFEIEVTDASPIN